MQNTFLLWGNAETRSHYQAERREKLKGWHKHDVYTNPIFKVHLVV